MTGYTRETLYTPVPNSLLGETLEQIVDLAELKATLRGYWLLHRKRGPMRAVSLNEFLADTALVNGLAHLGDGEEQVRRGLRLAVARGTFVTIESPTAGRLFFLNDAAGRRALARLGESPDAFLSVEGADPGEKSLAQQPNIFALYEDNIGTLTPMIAEQLKEAEERYRWSWIHDAFRIAVSENKRSWRYIDGILRRWSSQGRGGDTVEGKEHGKSGRHHPQDQRQRHIEEYERRRRRDRGIPSARRDS